MFPVGSLSFEEMGGHNLSPAFGNLTALRYLVGGAPSLHPLFVRASHEADRDSFLTGSGRFLRQADGSAAVLAGPAVAAVSPQRWQPGQPLALRRLGRSVLTSPGLLSSFAAQSDGPDAVPLDAHGARRVHRYAIRCCSPQRAHRPAYRAPPPAQRPSPSVCFYAANANQLRSAPILELAALPRLAVLNLAQNPIVGTISP